MTAFFNSGPSRVLNWRSLNGPDRLLSAVPFWKYRDGFEANFAFSTMNGF
jgi:hypothetical protein